MEWNRVDYRLAYRGQLRTEMTHLASGQVVPTDAPVDNHGKGEAFSPTDIVASGLAACMMTVLGIKANEMGVPLERMEAEVMKSMTAAPRRIAGIGVRLYLSAPQASERDRHVLEATARACPVARSLHPDLEQDLRFIWEA